MTRRTLLKLSVPAAIACVLLAGCGAHPSHKSAMTKHDRTHRVCHIHKHARHHSKKFNDQDMNGYGTKSASKKAQYGKKSAMTKNSSSAKHSDNTHPTVNLGHGIKGTQDNGAGQVYISFDIDGWHIVSHGNDVDESSNTAETYASRVVDEVESMPLRGHGNLQINENNATAQVNGHTISGSTENVLSQLAAK